MIFRKALLGAIAALLLCPLLKAQTFETRTTKYGGEEILEKLVASGNQTQLAIRDSVIKARTGTLYPSDTLETFFNGHHLGLVIYRNGRPFELIGFWSPNGSPVDGGTMFNGTGVIKTPFNPKEVQNFKSESVCYVSGAKNGPAFYLCDCETVLRRGTFTFNKKTGLWEEFDRSGKFRKQKQLEVPPPIDIIVADTVPVVPIDKDFLIPAHCMMQPDLKDCPNLGPTK